MLLVGPEHVKKIGHTRLSILMILAACVLLYFALFSHNLYHKSLVAAYICIP
jgi:hypothetical protein